MGCDVHGAFFSVHTLTARRMYQSIRSRHFQFPPRTPDSTAAESVDNYRPQGRDNEDLSAIAGKSFKQVHRCRPAALPSRLCSLRHHRHGEGLFIQSGNKLSTGRHHYTPRRPTSLTDWKIALQTKLFPTPRCHGNPLLSPSRSHFHRADLKWMNLLVHFALRRMYPFWPVTLRDGESSRWKPADTVEGLLFVSGVTIQAGSPLLPNESGRTESSSSVCSNLLIFCLCICTNAPGKLAP